MNPLPDFPSFFQALWGHPCFPWQAALALQLESTPWPAWITLPTGTGKTSALDIAVYNLARQASRPPQERTAPVRIVFAVNRRIVVDEAFERARSIAGKLAVACGHRKNEDLTEKDRFSSGQMAWAIEILRPLAEVLRQLSGEPDGPPLEAFPLRGATFTDHSWARTPTQPLILTTTLDQLGSRLLFRGYGKVSELASSLHAALLANDALLILDEAHTAKAFSQTLVSVEKLRERAEEPLPVPFRAVQLTATPPPDGAGGFQLGPEDYENPVIHARVHAAKPARLIPVPEAEGAKRHDMLARIMAEEGVALLKDGPRRILLVVNRIATAQRLHEALNAPKVRKEHGAAVEILTGRLRPIDREELVKAIVQRHQLKSAAPAAEVPPLLLIATQCVEVGADFDFDALLTELAPLDSLRQRFGRLNRYGRAIPAPAAVFAPSEALDERKPDPIYGDCLPRVWKWLLACREENETVDFGIEGFKKHLPPADLIGQYLVPSLDAPVLLPAHLDLLCQTSPRPHHGPEPSLYIHGPGRDFAEVTVLLRADVPLEQGPELEKEAIAALDAAPPLGTEGASLPLSLVRQWLADPGKAKDEEGDAPAESIPPPPRKPGKHPLRTAYYNKTAGGFALLTDLGDLRPGATLILPAQHGAALSSLMSLAAMDLAEPWRLDQMEAAHLLARDRFLLRLHPPIVAALGSVLIDAGAKPGLLEPLLPLFPTEEKEEEAGALTGAAAREMLEEWFRELTRRQDDNGEDRGFQEKDWARAMPKISALLARHLPEQHPQRKIWALAEKFRAGDWRAALHPLGGALLRSPRRAGYTPWPLDPEELGRQRQEADEKVTLDAHSRGVSRRASRYAAALGLTRFQGTARLAALWHDLGKADPRFQAWLYGSTVWATETKPKLAKSGGFTTRAVRRMLRDIAGVPAGFRHEFLSTLIVAQSQSADEQPERDLILHLIASHHGYCRASAPVVPDKQPEPFEASIEGENGDTEKLLFAGHPAPLANFADGVPERFWALTRRFGWWGLPMLESLIRLADQSESARPSHGEADGAGTPSTL